MLSQIENDIATPSIKTLQFLADHLEVPLSFLMVGEHDDEYNKDYQYDDAGAINAKARQIFFDGDYTQYIEIIEHHPEVLEEYKESAMLMSFSYIEAASRHFLSGEISKCLDCCKKAEGCVYKLGGLPLAKQIKNQIELYRYLCAPALTDDGMEYTQGRPSSVDAGNFLSRTFDKNGVCRNNMIEAFKALKRDDPQEALKYLREAEEFIENYNNHPFKRELYKLFELAHVKSEDYKNAHLYSSKILDLYSGR
jgi:transcriptional regulator with XRE-family HTH domain